MCEEEKKGAMNGMEFNEQELRERAQKMPNQMGTARALLHRQPISIGLDRSTCMGLVL